MSNPVFVKPHSQTKSVIIRGGSWYYSTVGHENRERGWLNRERPFSQVGLRLIRSVT